MSKYVLRIEDSADRTIVQDTFVSLESLAEEFQAHRRAVDSTRSRMRLDMSVRKVTDKGEAALSETEQARLSEILEEAWPGSMHGAR